jgi:hypothetical protein
MSWRWTALAGCAALLLCLEAGETATPNSSAAPSVLFAHSVISSGVFAARNLSSSNEAPQEPSSTQLYSVAGTVVNAVTGAALARVKVSLADTRERTHKAETITNDAGHFEFTGVPPGKYSLQGSRSGYLTSSYEQHEQYSTAIVTGPDFDTGKLVLRLMPMAMIAGHVLDESGEPVRQAQVQLFLEDHSGGLNRIVGAGGAQSDDRGYFDVGVLRPGTYFVSATAKPWYAVHPQIRPVGLEGGPGAAPVEDVTQKISPGLDVAYPTTFYGGATEAENASAIQLKGGEHQEIELRLAPVPSLHFLVHAPVRELEPNPNGEGLAQNVPQMPTQMPMLQKREFDSLQYVQPGNMQAVAPGVWEVSGVPAGKYQLTLKGISMNGVPANPDQVSEINLVRDGQDLGEAQGEVLGNLKVTLKMPGADPLPRQYAVGLRDARLRIVAFQPGNANGETLLEDVRPGKYGIVVGTQGKSYVVSRVVSTAGAVAGNAVEIAPGVSADVTAELTGGEARIEGVAQKNGKPVAGIMVALVPKDANANPDLLRRDQSDFDGTFTLRSVVPGSYTVVAVEDAWGFDWMKPGVLAGYAQHGQQVIVGEKKVVRLPEALQVQSR